MVISRHLAKTVALPNNSCNVRAGHPVQTVDVVRLGNNQSISFRLAGKTTTLFSVHA